MAEVGPSNWFKEPRCRTVEEIRASALTLPKISMKELTKWDYNPDECDILYTHVSAPSYFRVDKVDEDILFLEQLERHHTRSYGIKYEDEPDFDSFIKVQVAIAIRCIPEYVWMDFRKDNNIDSAIQLAANILFLLVPKDILCLRPRYNVRARQLNELWERFTQRLNFDTGDACLWIMQILDSVDKDRFSLVTETDASHMLHAALHQSSARSLHRSSIPYRVVGSENETNQDRWLKDIMEVLNKMGFPSMLNACDHTRLLCKILSPEVDVQWLMSTLNLKFGGERSSGLLIKVFGSLVNEVVKIVKGKILDSVMSVLQPLDLFFHLNHTSLISREVRGLINVAEVRRIALECRFIRRSHFLWAFYERGHVLPPQIRKTIKLDSIDEDHPPYHIYMAAVKLALSFREKVRLENFIFAVIYSKDITVPPGDQVIELEPLYKAFSDALNN